MLATINTGWLTACTATGGTSFNISIGFQKSLQRFTHVTSSNKNNKGLISVYLSETRRRVHLFLPGTERTPITFKQKRCDWSTFAQSNQKRLSYLTHNTIVSCHAIVLFFSRLPPPKNRNNNVPLCVNKTIVFLWWLFMPLPAMLFCQATDVQILLLIRINGGFLKLKCRVTFFWLKTGVCITNWGLFAMGIKGVAEVALWEVFEAIKSLKSTSCYGKKVSTFGCITIFFLQKENCSFKSSSSFSDRHMMPQITLITTHAQQLLSLPRNTAI